LQSPHLRIMPGEMVSFVSPGAWLGILSCDFKVRTPSFF
jgi:hypothetical protein